MLFFFNWELFGSFLDAFDKYVDIMCYFWEIFQHFGSIRRLFGALFTNLENSTEITCHFLKTPEFRRSSKILELATTLSPVQLLLDMAKFYLVVNALLSGQ